MLLAESTPPDAGLVEILSTVITNLVKTGPAGAMLAVIIVFLAFGLYRDIRGITPPSTTLDDATIKSIRDHVDALRLSPADELDKLSARIEEIAGQVADERRHRELAEEYAKGVRDGADATGPKRRA